MDSSYEEDIDGQDISSYDGKMEMLYDDIKDAEDKSASYGKGLYLVSNEKAGLMKCGELGSGAYWQALKKAAGNAFWCRCCSNYAWLGAVDRNINTGLSTWLVMAMYPTVSSATLLPRQLSI